MLCFTITVCLGAVYGFWPMWGGDLSNSGFQTMRGAMSSEPVVKWMLATNAWVEWQFSAVADCDGDGMPEVIAASLDRNLYCLDGSTGTPRWIFPMDGDPYSTIGASATVADCDGDGELEVLIGTDEYPKLYCINARTGAEEWRFATTLQVHSSPAVADCDRDGFMEVLFGTADRIFFCLRGSDGSEKWRFNARGYIFSSPAVGDCDGDGAMEVVFGSLDSSVYCLSGSGTKKWEFHTGHYVYGSPAIADLDGDGLTEVIIASCDNNVYCLRGSDGTQKWAFTTGSALRSSPAIADVDGDGQMEVIIGNTDPEGRVYCISSGGAMKWFYQTQMGSVHTPGSLADVDMDNKLEFLVPNALSDTLVCLNAENGSVLWKKAVVSDVHSPFPADIDGDECIEIVVGTHPDAGGYSLFALDDPANTQGCGPLKLEEETQAKGPFFVARGRGLYLFLPSEVQISLALYDAGGRLCQNLYNGSLGPGGHTFIPRPE
ncbi:MAG: FG-GAP-like repeat-containing protein, partial [candidate division WOR-3 bacterium]